MTTASVEAARTVVLVAGPTASGKSGLATTLARSFGGDVINADSMQVYRELRIVTARPSVEEEAMAPHRLYGCMSAAEACSVGDWLAMAAPAIENALVAGRVPVVVGGTGLYLKSLVEGIAEIPTVPDTVRAKVRALYEEIGGAAFRDRLMRHDPSTASRITDADKQRLTRAMEVFEATGRPLGDWLAGGNRPVLDGVRYATIVIEPPRETLYASINRRFETMVDLGAVDEVQGFLKLGLDPALPAMKAVGVRELGGYLAGEIDLANAVAAAQQASRNYAKRQLTWFRNQIQKDFSIFAQYSERENEKIFSFIRQFGLTDSV